jgi:Uma2 family endonuclease
MGPLAINRADKYTYKDYLSWENDERWELIHGYPHCMTPAPSRRHQEISIELLRQFANFLLDKPCNVYGAPFDVRFPEGGEKDDDIQTVVQPDISVVCDRSKLDDRGCKGSPDLIVEIISLATARKDMKEKFLLYEEAGVKEYWIVDPAARTVMVFRQAEVCRFGRPEIYSEEDTITVGTFEGLSVELRGVFKE